jgi:hypothetical protein
VIDATEIDLDWRNLDGKIFTQAPKRHSSSARPLAGHRAETIAADSVPGRARGRRRPLPAVGFRGVGTSLAPTPVALAAPLYGLFGTILGALIGGLATFGLERHRERSQAAAAKRLLAIELHNALEATWEIRFDGHWPHGWAREWTNAWQSLRGSLLLRPPSRESLTHIGRACTRLDQLQHAVNDRSLAGCALTGPNELFLWEMENLLQSACAALSIPYTGDYKKRPRDPTSTQLQKWEREAADAGAPPPRAEET